MRGRNSSLWLILAIIAGFEPPVEAKPSPEMRVRQLELELQRARAEIDRLKNLETSEVVCRRSDIGASRAKLPRSEQDLGRLLEGLSVLGINPVYDARRVGQAGAQPLFYLVGKGCGFRSGDRITHINGVPIGETHRAQQQLSYSAEWRFTVTSLPFAGGTEPSSVVEEVPSRVTPAKPPPAIMLDKGFDLAAVLGVRGRAGLFVPYFSAGREKGFLAHEIVPSGVAAAAGLKSGDVVVAVNGERLTHADGKEQIRRQWNTKGTIVFTVDRGGRDFSLTPLADQSRVHRAP